MGQQHHESALHESLQRELTRCGSRDRWTLSTVRVAPMRAGTGDVRLPLGLIARGPAMVATSAAAFAYRRADLVHRFDLRLPPHRGAEVVTVHDLPPLRFGDEGTLPTWAAASARRARVVICPSAFAADEVATLLGQARTRVVPNGVAETFRDAPAADAAVLAGLGLKGRFVIHAGGATERKNLGALAGAWRRISAAVPDATLALCGPPHPRRTELFAGLPRVRLIGRVAQQEVAGLMAAAAAVVVPSLYEGFGLPALEGMACGTPVVATDRGALPEVCGDAALLVAPTSDALAEGMEAVLTDALFARRLADAGRARAAPYTWERTAAATLAVYEEALA
ncbi:MAG: glycosyltransferase family 4 protein [Actinobacteria bacterium]|nr:glycosyltransferase family 4 protein [Actinomycetota bacterium]